MGQPLGDARDDNVNKTQYGVFYGTYSLNTLLWSTSK